jgi:hypothetical protein
MKKIYLALIIAIGLGAYLFIACQSSTNGQVVCENTANPFPTPSINHPLNALTIYGPNIDIGKVCVFRGSVSRGEIYSTEIAPDLYFCLRPNSFPKENGGWDIIISDTTPCSVSFAGLVTPPFYDVMEIQGWNFRNTDNTGENEDSVKAPQYERVFNFLLNRDDYNRMREMELCLSINDCQINQIAEIPKSRGILTINEIKLGNLEKNDTAWIEYMEFIVEVYLPKD